MTILLASAGLLALLAGPGDEAAIRAARARFNRAIAAHDLAHLGDEWTDDIHVITSRGVAAAGREAYHHALSDQFPTRPDVVYDRRSERIEIQDGWGTGSETGTWIGTFTEPGGPVRVTGRYVAQWRKTPAGWKLSSESFVALTCRGGAYCRTKI